jgi:phosphodiesterase/alkaline phosphatase D-like protein
MRRLALLASAALAALAIAASGAQAAVPTLGPVAVTEISDQSAFLQGTVSPGGQATTYYFQYTTLATFSESSFATAASTPPASAGAGFEAKKVSARIAGLTPDTIYYFRLVAGNASGDSEGKPQTFNTSHGVELACEGDACQSLPPPPVDPTLTTLLFGLGNPAPHYHRLNHLKPKHKKRHYKKHHKPKRQNQGKR